MNVRIVAAALVVVLAVGGTAGCASQPEPVPSTTGFATDAEALAAAEKTYRLYVDALNERRRNPGAGADPQDFLIGEALEVDIDTQRRLEAEGLRVVGDSIVASIDPGALSSMRTRIEIAVCLDSSETQVLKGDKNVTPTERNAVLSLAVTLVAIGTDLRISSSDSSDSNQC